MSETPWHYNTLTTLRCHLDLSEPGFVYEVKLLAYNGNGESDSFNRLVSLTEESAHNTGNF